MRLIVAALTLMSSVAVAAPPCAVPGLPKISGKSYHIARGMMIEAGFMPVMTPENPDISDIVNQPKRAYGYGEIVDCAGTGYAACMFEWKSSKAHFFIRTHGELDRVVNSVSCSL